MDGRIERIVIAGGGTAGWMAAAALAKLLGANGPAIALVESEAIGTVGVGEATIPPFTTFNAMLGLDEADFLRATGGSFKLGIAFHDWARAGDRYVHPFGRFGADFGDASFHAYWLRLAALGEAPPLGAFSLQTLACEQARFMRPIANGDSPLSDIAYAYHFDAGLYAAHLRRFAEALGVVRHEGRIVEVARDGGTGRIDALMLDHGERVAGDLFIDCTGFRALLIGETLGSGWEDWSHWLPCDRAVTVPCARTAPLIPYTIATARPAGWQWRIPLQHRTGNGHVYCSRHMSDDAATALLMAHLDGEPLGEPRLLRFRTGRRRQMWVGNCIAMGLAAGFLEPLESTSIWLVHSAIKQMMTLFPDTGFAPAAIDRFNRVMADQFAHIRDFLICHYHATERDDAPFWRGVRASPIPESLAARLALFRESGRVFCADDELFSETSWFALLAGQHVRARRHDPLADAMPLDTLRARMAHIRSVVATSAAHMPDHARYLEDYCR